jgi:hypothetical protein
MKTTILLVLIFVLSAGEPLFPQCSDAGVCILGRKHKSEIKEDLNTISLGYRLGTSGKESDLNGAQNDLIFNSAILDADLSVSPVSRLSVSIPFTVIEGPLGTNSGIGDLSILYNHTFVIKKKHNLTISVGGKAALGDVNTSDSLPQRYMPGLGTNDMILGASYGYSSYSVSAAYQKPFGRSANFVTRLKRGDDFLFRAGYGQQFGKLNIKAEVLTILRIQKSSIISSVDTNGVESYIDIEGSNEPQVNLLVSIGYMVAEKFLLTIDGAIPFLKRDYNYDGLKRKFTAGLSLSYLFKL